MTKRSLFGSALSPRGRRKQQQLFVKKKQKNTHLLLPSLRHFHRVRSWCSASRRARALVPRYLIRNHPRERNTGRRRLAREACLNEVSSTWPARARLVGSPRGQAPTSFFSPPPGEATSPGLERLCGLFECLHSTSCRRCSKCTVSAALPYCIGLQTSCLRALSRQRRWWRRSKWRLSLSPLSLSLSFSL